MAAARADNSPLSIRQCVFSAGTTKPGVSASANINNRDSSRFVVQGLIITVGFVSGLHHREGQTTVAGVSWRYFHKERINRIMFGGIMLVE